MIDYTTLMHNPHAPVVKKLTREEFEAECIAISGGTIEELREYHDIVPCDCGRDSCPGWWAVYLLENRRRARKAGDA